MATENGDSGATITDELSPDDLRAMASEFAAIIEDLATEDGRTNWLLLVGGCLTALARSLAPAGIPPENLAWMHSSLLNVHEAIHAYARGGPEAVAELQERMERLTDEQEAGAAPEGDPAQACADGKTTLH